jgi:hypothetical protein
MPQRRLHQRTLRRLLRGGRIGPAAFVLLMGSNSGVATRRSVLRIRRGVAATSPTVPERSKEAPAVLRRVPWSRGDVLLVLWDEWNTLQDVLSVLQHVQTLRLGTNPVPRCAMRTFADILSVLHHVPKAFIGVLTTFRACRTPRLDADRMVPARRRWLRPS